jgi:hypothetical protein
MGLTPVTEDLPTGSWEVRLEKEGFRTETRIVEVAAGAPGTLTLTLRKSGEGTIAFRVKPDADAYLDGVKILSGGKGTLVRTEAGRIHRLELVHDPSFGRIVREVEVAQGDTLDLGEIAFVWGTLNVICNQTASIYLDGRKLNRDTPCRLERIAVGPHRVGLRRPGFLAARAELLDERGQVIGELAPRRDRDGFPEFEIEVTRGALAGIRAELAPMAAPR